MGHKGKMPNRKFLINWRGYSEDEDTWEEEENLAACADMVHRYCTTNKLTKSDLELIGGAKDNAKITENWVNLKKVKEQIPQFMSTRELYKAPLKVIAATTADLPIELEEDSLIILL